MCVKFTTAAASQRPAGRASHSRHTAGDQQHHTAAGASHSYGLQMHLLDANACLQLIIPVPEMHIDMMFPARPAQLGRTVARLRRDCRHDPAALSCSTFASSCPRAWRHSQLLPLLLPPAPRVAAPAAWPLRSAYGQATNTVSAADGMHALRGVEINASAWSDTHQLLSDTSLLTRSVPPPAAVYSAGRTRNNLTADAMDAGSANTAHGY